MTTKLVIGGDAPLDVIKTPFLPVYVAMRDVMLKGGISVEQVIEAVVSIALTAAINMRIQFAEDENCPNIEGLARVLCFHIMGAAREAQEEVKQQTGEGATRQ